jgi:hypothetical protein
MKQYFKSSCIDHIKINRKGIEKKIKFSEDGRLVFSRSHIDRRILGDKNNPLYKRGRYILEKAGCWVD